MRAGPFRFRGWYMTVDLEKDEVLSSAIEGIPKIVELITTVPDEKRSLALQAAHQSYLQTAQALGYAPTDAQEWASTVMSMLEIASLASERTAQKVLSDN
jgi:hypothetical protein